MNDKRQSLINIVITFLTSCAFLVLILFLFESFHWNVAYYNFFSLIKVGLLFGLLNISVKYISGFVMAYMMKDMIKNITSLGAKQLSKILISKLLIEFILSGLMIWVSIEVFSNEVLVGGFGTLIGLIFATIIFKGIFSLFVSYQQNKDQLGGMQ